MATNDPNVLGERMFSCEEAYQAGLKLKSLADWPKEPDNLMQWDIWDEDRAASWRDAVWQGIYDQDLARQPEQPQ